MVFEPQEIWGSLILAALALAFQVLVNRPYRPNRRRKHNFGQQLFPGSGKQPRTAWFHFLFAIPFSLLILGIEMTGNYTVVKWAFVGTGLSSAVVAYFALIILKPLARKAWSAALALTVTFALVNLYSFLCPTVTISPTQAVFSAHEPAGMNESHSFRILNKVDTDLYSVVFELKPTSKLDSENFQLSLGQHQVRQIVGMRCADSAGSLVFFGIITHLEPHESHEIELYYSSSANVTPSSEMPKHLDLPSGKGPMFGASIVSFSDDSASQLHSSSMAEGINLQPFVFDETVNCSQFIL